MKAYYKGKEETDDFGGTTIPIYHTLPQVVRFEQISGYITLILESGATTIISTTLVKDTANRCEIDLSVFSSLVADKADCAFRISDSITSFVITSKHINSPLLGEPDPYTPTASHSGITVEWLNAYGKQQQQIFCGYRIADKLKDMGDANEVEEVLIEISEGITAQNIDTISWLTQSSDIKVGGTDNIYRNSLYDGRSLVRKPSIANGWSFGSGWSANEYRVVCVDNNEMKELTTPMIAVNGMLPINVVIDVIACSADAMMQVDYYDKLGFVIESLYYLSDYNKTGTVIDASIHNEDINSVQLRFYSTTKKSAMTIDHIAVYNGNCTEFKQAPEDVVETFYEATCTNKQTPIISASDMTSSFKLTLSAKTWS